MDHENAAYLAEVDSLTMAAKAAQFVQIGPKTYRKYNPLTGIRTTVQFSGNGDEYAMHIKHETELNVQSDMLDLNVAQANDFSGYKGRDMFQATRIPLVEYQKIMKRCGHVPGQGHDEKKFKQILNSNEYSKLRCVPGKI